MKAAIEQELKFEADGIEIERLGGVPIESHIFVSSYHDTSDRRLLRAGITLRRRVENGLGTWQLKLPRRENGEHRLELEEPGGPASLPPTLERVLTGILQGSELEQVATLETHRHGRRIDGVDVTVDEVSVLDGLTVVTRFSEIEAELVNGSQTSIEHVGGLLRELGGTPVKQTPKILRVVDLPEAPRAEPGAPAVDHLLAFIREQLDELRANDPIVRATNDAEAVHEMRVAVRRLRSVLRTARPMLDRSWTNELRDELDLFGRRLGAVRDLDVLIERLHDEVGQIGEDLEGAQALFVPLESDRDRARMQLWAAMDDPRYRQLLDRLEGAAGFLPVTRADLTVEQLARKEFKKLLSFEKSAAHDDDRQLHKLRIHGKRARYAAELASRSRGERAARFIEVSKDLQDVLGEHQDAVVALAQLRRIARTVDSRSSAFTAGRLTECEEQRKLEARNALPPLWKRLKRRGKAAW